MVGFKSVYSKFLCHLGYWIGGSKCFYPLKNITSRPWGPHSGTYLPSCPHPQNREWIQVYLIQVSHRFFVRFQIWALYLLLPHFWVAVTDSNKWCPNKWDLEIGGENEFRAHKAGMHVCVCVCACVWALWIHIIGSTYIGYYINNDETNGKCKSIDLLKVFYPSFSIVSLSLPFFFSFSYATE